MFLAQATARKVSAHALCRIARKARRWRLQSPHMTTIGTMPNMTTMKRWACWHGLWVYDITPMCHGRAWCGVAVCWVLGSLTPGWSLATMSCCSSRLCMVLTPDCGCAILTWTRGVRCDTDDASSTASPLDHSRHGLGQHPLWRMRRTAGQCASGRHHIPRHAG